MPIDGVSPTSHRWVNIDGPLMPFVILLILAFAAAVAVSAASLRYPTAAGAPPPASAAAAQQLGEEAVRHAWLRRLLRGRLDAGTATGLALTVALAIAIVGGLVLGSLAYLMRTNARLVELDASVGQWGADHATRLVDAHCSSSSPTSRALR